MREVLCSVAMRIRLVRRQSLPKEPTWLGLKPIISEGNLLGFELLSQKPSSSKLPLSVAVLHCSLTGTRAALMVAQHWLRTAAGTHLLVLQVVPSSSPLSNVPAQLKSTIRRVGALASSLETKPELRIFLCRDRFETLRRVLQPHSLVLVGGRADRVMMKEGPLARALRDDGHEVLLVPI